MQFSWSFNAGQVTISIALIALAWRLLLIDTFIRRFFIEHEILMRDYCDRHQINLDDLPTRFGLTRKGHKHAPDNN